MAKRATFGTKLGVIAASVGSSVGLGNIWKFPYEAGQNGGGAFLLVYLIFVLLLGIPVMISEFIVGRESRANVTDSFKKLAPNSKWHYVGYLGILATILILGFYSVIAGWTLEYVYQAISNSMQHSSAQELNTAFNAFVSNTYQPIIWTFLFLAINYFVIAGGVQKGIERTSNILMPMLFLILIVFSVQSLSMDGAKEGLKFLFSPDFSKIDSDVVLNAMGQAFFSLSLGMGCLITYGSYFSNTTKLPQTAFTVALLDTMVAIIAGVVIFPAVFTFGLSPSQGPELIFITLPNIFNQMPGGYFWSVLFFLLVSMAALTSTISMCEVVVAFMHEKMKLSRKRASLYLILFIAVLSTLCSLSFGVMKDYTILGKTLFDIFDFISSNILLPLGGLLLSVFVGWRLDKAITHRQLSNNGTLSLWYAKPFIILLKYVAPIAISLIFLSGLGLF